jgi:hypothetical protein
MGFLWETLSPQVAFGFGAIMALTAAGLLWFAVKEEERGENKKDGDPDRRPGMKSIHV